MFVKLNFSCVWPLTSGIQWDELFTFTSMSQRKKSGSLISVGQFDHWATENNNYCVWNDMYKSFDIDYLTVSLFGLACLLWEDNQLALVLFKSLNISLKGFCRPVFSPVVNWNTNGWRNFSRDACSLERETMKRKIFNKKSFKSHGMDCGVAILNNLSDQVTSALPLPRNLPLWLIAWRGIWCRRQEEMWCFKAECCKILDYHSFVPSDVEKCVGNFMPATRSTLTDVIEVVGHGVGQRVGYSLHHGLPHVLSTPHWK